MRSIPLKPIKRIMGEFTNFRISNDSQVEMSKMLENEIKIIIKQSELIALNKNKKTIQEEDIVLAKELIFD